MKAKLFVVLAGAALLAGCQTGANTRENAQYTKGVPANGQVILNQWTDINPDCSPRGRIEVSLIEQPEHGRVTISQVRDYPHYSSVNPRSHCNTRRVPTAQAAYKPDPNYVGSDRASFRTIFQDGDQWIRRYQIEVR